MRRQMGVGMRRIRRTRHSSSTVKSWSVSRSWERGVTALRRCQAQNRCRAISSTVRSIIENRPNDSGAVPQRHREPGGEWMEARLESEKVYDGKLFQVYRDRVRLDNGHEVQREIVRRPGSVVIVPLDAQCNVVLVRQFVEVT